MSVEVAGWNIGPPGWVKAMQGVGQLTVTPTSRYSRYKTQLSEILTDRAKKKKTKTGPTPKVEPRRGGTQRAYMGHKLSSKIRFIFLYSLRR